MSDRPTPETDSRKAHRNASGYNIDLADLLYMHQLERERDEARELARELRDALTEVMRVSTPHMRRIGDTHIIKVADATIQKAKEVLG